MEWSHEFSFAISWTPKGDCILKISDNLHICHVILQLMKITNMAKEKKALEMVPIVT